MTKPVKPHLPAVLLARYRRGVVGERDRVVHVVSVPENRTSASLATLCGVSFDPGEAETVTEGEPGAPCFGCLTRARIPEFESRPES